MNRAPFFRRLVTSSLIAAGGSWLALPLFALSPIDLRCENATDPLGIDVARPQFSWKLVDPRTGARQTAWQILVAADEATLARDQGEVWDSGRRASDETLHLPYAGRPLRSSESLRWKVRVWDETGAASPWSASATWTMGVLDAKDWAGAEWITDADQLRHEGEPANQRPASPEANATLLVRREFEVSPSLRRAILQVSGLGHYQLHLNGVRQTDDLLTPAWSAYPKTIYYDTVDLTSRLRSGRNALGLVLAGGMYHVAEGRYVKFTTPFHALAARALLRLEYADGHVEEIVTKPGWEVASGPTTFANMFGGEDYDARIEPHGWDLPEFDPAGNPRRTSPWRKAVVHPGLRGELRGATQVSPPMRAQGNLPPKSIRELRPGVAIYDLGQNVALMIRLRSRGPAGARLKILPAELLKPDGSLNRSSCTPGGGEVSWNYTLDGNPAGETWEPRFFYHGCRYLEVHAEPATEGGELPRVERLEGLIVHSDSPPAGDFECSNDLLNRIRTLIRWAQRSNLAHVITDCPHRERLGWLEQYHLHGPSLRYEWDVTRLYAKTFRDMADAQLDNGLIPDIAPEYVVFDGGFRDSPEWGSAGVLTPWQHLEWTADPEPVRRNYDSMKRYVAYLGTRAKDHLLDHGLGDWYDLGPKPPGTAQLTPIALTATAFYFADVDALARMAAHLGETNDARRYEGLRQQIREAFNARFLDAKAGSYATGSQTANALPLVLDLAPEGQRSNVLAALVRDVESRGFSVTAGDVGHRYLLRALAEGGRSDVVYALHRQTERPGYGYILKSGATALTEAWNADPNSSHNHFMLGHLTEWLYHDLAGIQNDPASPIPAFKRVIIHPAVVGDLTWVRAQYDSLRGRIRSAWRRENRHLTMEVTIPPNTTAVVHVPGRQATPLGGALAGVRRLGENGQETRFEVPSGTHRFASEL